MLARIKLCKKLDAPDDSAPTHAPQGIGRRRVSADGVESSLIIRGMPFLKLSGGNK